MGKKEVEKLDQVKNGGAINEFINEFNGVVGEWLDIYGSIKDGKEKTLKACGMDKTKGAGLKEVLLSLIVTMISDLNMSLDDLKKQVTFTVEKPFFKIDAVEKFMAVYNNMVTWIEAFIDTQDRASDFMGKVEAIPDKAKEIGENAKSELESSSLDPLSKGKVIADTAKSVSKIKDVASTIMDQIKGIPAELKSLQDGITGLKEAIESGDIIKLGEKCREKKLGDFLKCYEEAYGKIDKGGEGDGNAGCCITF